MRKSWKIAAISLTVVVLATGFGTVAFAADEPTVVPGTCAGEGMGGGFKGAFGGNSAVITEVLGLTHEELYELRLEGKTLAEIAAAQGVSEDALVSAMLEQRQEVLQAAVEEGRLTQEQAEFMLQNMEQNILTRIDSADAPRGNGTYAGITGEGETAGFGGARAGFGGMRR